MSKSRYFVAREVLNLVPTALLAAVSKRVFFVAFLARFYSRYEYTGALQK